MSIFKFFVWIWLCWKDVIIDKSVNMCLQFGIYPSLYTPGQLSLMDQGVNINFVQLGVKIGPSAGSVRLTRPFVVCSITRRFMNCPPILSTGRFDYYLKLSEKERQAPVPISIIRKHNHHPPIVSRESITLKQSFQEKVWLSPPVTLWGESSTVSCCFSLRRTFDCLLLSLFHEKVWLSPIVILSGESLTASSCYSFRRKFDCLFLSLFHEKVWLSHPVTLSGESLTVSPFTL
jgi:hypothetical protein